MTPSKRPRPHISDTTSIPFSSTTNRLPISEIPITSRSHSQPSLTHTPLVHIPHSESVERYVKYKQPAAIKTIQLQSQLNLVHIPDTEYPPVLSLKLPSEINKTTSKLYPPITPLRKPSTAPSNLSESSTSISNLSDDASEYIPSQESTSSLFQHHRFNLRNLPTRTTSINTSTRYQLFYAIK